MRTASRWATAGAGFTFVMVAAFYVVYMAGWKCHQQPPDAQSYVCLLSSVEHRLHRNLILIFAPALAAAIAVLAAPSHKAFVGVLAVVIPAVLEASFIWSRITGGISPISDVIPFIVLAIPSAATTCILVFISGRRRVA